MELYWNHSSRFSQLLQACDLNGPQLVTRRGVATAVVVPYKAWQQMQSQTQPSLKALLLMDDRRHEMPISQRGQAKRRQIEPF
jgi:antitoxin Phd